jgi:hypothetical protein
MARTASRVDLSPYQAPLTREERARQVAQTRMVEEERADQVKRDQANPYANSFALFLRDCVRTTDKAMAGKIRQWPTGPEWDEYWADWETSLLCCSPLLVDKTRRTMASNVICAFDLWLASGGTDPRWPVLLESRENRSVLIQAQKLGKNREDEGCSAEFVTRIEQLYDNAVRAGIRTLWPSFPEWEFGFGWGRASNGGKILAIPEGPGQVRGAGTTFLHMEEGGEWEQAEATCSVALPSLFPHGHAVMVTTPVVGSYVQRIRNGEIKSGKGDALPEPPVTKKLPLTVKGDWYHLEIRGKRDIPGYDPIQVGRGMPPQTFRREVEGDWTASSGKVVFEEYEEKHEPNCPLPFDPKRPLICGWDLPAATGGTPAFIASQLYHTGQWLIYGSILPALEEQPGVWEFGERVAEWLTEKFAKPCGLRLEDLKLIHYGDPAGSQKGLSGKTGVEILSAYDILARGDKIETGIDERTYQPKFAERPGRGWYVQPGEVSSIRRVELVKQRLILDVNGAPGLVVAPSATFIRELFRGAYHYKQRSDGQYELDPNKNRHSHVADALMYACSRLHLQHPQESEMRKYLQKAKRDKPVTRTMSGGRAFR